MKKIRKTIEIDAANQSVGRVATQVAMILMGKHEPDYNRQLDTGDMVQVNNVSKVKFTGRKLEQKDYFHHTMHPGGLKRTPMRHAFEKDPTDVLKRAVYGMLPKNRQRDTLMKRLTLLA